MMYVKRNWEYWSNRMPYYTHRMCTVNLSRIFLHAFWYTCPSFTDSRFKCFHCKAQLFVHATFHFYRHLFCSMDHVHRLAIYLYYMFSTYLQFPRNPRCPQTARQVYYFWLEWNGWDFQVLVKFFWKTMNTYFTLRYRIPCFSMQGSYILVRNFMQKQL
jgi:hypothetical protein